MKKTKKDNFLDIVSNEVVDTLDKNSERIRNREMLRESQSIAIKVITKLDELRWSQKDLAKKMDVSPQQISKIVSGKENLTIETQIKHQNILNIPILASYYENKSAERNELITTFEKRVKQPIQKQRVANEN